MALISLSEAVQVHGTRRSPDELVNLQEGKTGLTCAREVFLHLDQDAQIRTCRHGRMPVVMVHVKIHELAQERGNFLPSDVSSVISPLTIGIPSCFTQYCSPGNPHDFINFVNFVLPGASFAKKSRLHHEIVQRCRQ